MDLADPPVVVLQTIEWEVVKIFHREHGSDDADIGFAAVYLKW